MSLELLCLMGTEHNNSVHPRVSLIISTHYQTKTKHRISHFHFHPLNEFNDHTSFSILQCSAMYIASKQLMISRSWKACDTRILCQCTVQPLLSPVSAAENEEESYLSSHEGCLLHKKGNFWELCLLFYNTFRITFILDT